MRKSSSKWLASAFSLALAAGIGAAPAQLAAAPAEASHPVGGGRVLGLSSICSDCVPQKFATDFANDFLEAPVFDRNGDLYVLGILKATLWKVTPDGHTSVALKFPPEIKYPAGLKFGPDGTLYGVAMGSGLFSIDLSTKKVSLIANGSTSGGLPDGGFRGLDDLFVDSTGGMYMTDAAGSSVLQPVGQLFYRDAKGIVSRVISGGLQFPNGVVLSPDEKTLYINEWQGKRILAVPVISPGVLNKGFSYVFAWVNGGVGPDSLTADVNGNLYVAHFGSGEVLVYAPNGDYYGAIRLPEGAGEDVTNVAFKDGYLYITESKKSTVWRVKTKIPGRKLYTGG